ncbi:MAG: hypothetical protein EPN37_13335 [Chitinophagaceae bacterium]|nr:MAG: hypothetical protein EPN37_13335 [Chitinophagaceae bacterium]
MPQRIKEAQARKISAPCCWPCAWKLRFFRNDAVPMRQRLIFWFFLIKQKDQEVTIKNHLGIGKKTGYFFRRPVKNENEIKGALARKISGPSVSLCGWKL